MVKIQSFQYMVLKKLTATNKRIKLSYYLTPYREINSKWTSLVVWWLRIHLPVQGTWVWSLVWEDSTCLRANTLTCHIYWSPRTLESVLCRKMPPQREACPPQLESSSHLPQLEKVCTQQWRPTQAKRQENSKWIKPESETIKFLEET